MQTTQHLHFQACSAIGTMKMEEAIKSHFRCVTPGCVWCEQQQKYGSRPVPRSAGDKARRRRNLVTLCERNATSVSTINRSLRDGSSRCNHGTVHGWQTAHTCHRLQQCTCRRGGQLMHQHKPALAPAPTSPHQHQHQHQHQAHINDTISTRITSTTSTTSGSTSKYRQ